MTKSFYYMAFVHSGGWIRWWSESLDLVKLKLDAARLKYPDGDGSIVGLRIKAGA